MTTQLAVFNDALYLLGERKAVATSDATEPARMLLEIWDRSVKYCLEQEAWRFAERQATITPTVTTELAYGLTKAFTKPTDYIRLNAIASDAVFDTPVSDWHDRGTFWYSNSSTIYVQYVSSNASFGLNLAIWPESFAKYVAYYLAVSAALRLNPDFLSGQQGESGGSNPVTVLNLGLADAFKKAVEYNQIGGPSQFLPGADQAQLSVFNNALRMIGLRSLVKVTDSSEPARILLNLWNQTRDYCLEQGHWKFAMAAVKITPSLTEIPTFGYRNAFAKPADYVRVSAFCVDEYFLNPTHRYEDRGSFWYSDADEVYVKYVSKGATYGYDLAKWPESFTLFVTLYLATLASSRLIPDVKPTLITAPGNVGLEQAKDNALAKDSVAGPTQFLPQGNWAGARINRNRGRNSNTSLYGS